MMPFLQGDLVEEYKEVGHNIRLFSNMRFAQLTLFLALTAGLLTVTFGLNPPLEGLYQLILKLFGLFVTYFFWIMEERSSYFWKYYMDRAQFLEIQLGYFQYIGRNPKVIYEDKIPKLKFNATNAVRALFFVIELFWIFTLYMQVLS